MTDMREKCFAYGGDCGNGEKCSDECFESVDPEKEKATMTLEGTDGALVIGIDKKGTRISLVIPDLDPESPTPDHIIFLSAICHLISIEDRDFQELVWNKWDAIVAQKFPELVKQEKDNGCT